MSKFYPTGTAFYSLDLDHIADVFSPDLPESDTDYLARSLKDHHGPQNLSALYQQLSQKIKQGTALTLSPPESHLFATILRMKSKSLDYMDCDLGAYKTMLKFEKKWSKILFETEETCALASSHKVLQLQCGDDIKGYVPRRLLQKLTKVDELYQFIADEKAAYAAAREKENTKPTPQLITDLFAPTTNKAMELVDADGLPFKSAEAPKKTARQRLNEIQKEEDDVDFEYRENAKAFVKAVHEAKQQGHDLIMFTSLIEVLKE